MPLDPALLRPAQDGQRTLLRAVLADHRVRLSAHPDQDGQFPLHMYTGERRIGHQHQTAPVQSSTTHRMWKLRPQVRLPQTRSRGSAPSLVRSVWQHNGGSCPPVLACAATAAHTQSSLQYICSSFLCGWASCLPAPAHSPDGESRPAPFRRQLAQLSPQRPVIRPRPFITDHHAAHSNQCTRLTFAHPVMLPGMGDGFPVNVGRHHLLMPDP